LLIASDDFDFRPPSVRLGIERLVDCLERNPELSVASGRVNNLPYEFYLRISGGGEVQEVPIDSTVSLFEDRFLLDYVPCDLTVNYSLIRREVFRKARWDDDVKIGGGEHGAFFVDLKRAGYRVGWVPGVNINEQKAALFPSAQYDVLRGRAKNPERPCFKRRGIKKYTMSDGTVDYEEKQ
jgi:hypothetical protein